MPAKPNNEDRQLDQGGHVPQSAMYSQPWWRGVGNNTSFGENTLTTPTVEHLTQGAIQSQASTGLDNGASFNKDLQIAVSTQSDGSNGPGHQLKPSAAAVTMSGQLEPTSQMELVGHSIVLSSYPSDPQYQGMLTPFGLQTMVPPQLYGLSHGRMPLPLDMEEEPVYVNAKQFHGILRRRQARAKAELEKKVVKARKPYLHESRHQHAMRRARGVGGRFLNTKKPDNAADPLSNKSASLGSNLTRQSTSLSGSENFSSNGTGDSDSPRYLQERKRSMIQEHSSSNCNGGGHELLSIYSSTGNGTNVLGQQSQRAYGNGVSNGTFPIN
ncbi:hypothetical protein K2173_011249 [Erythroxylum novogranatense]|uniref:Nuclear transcription factor Y subunit n=1 Tax=Erythroxylum novogranatense TaxID=1862640 RepID=A0AAV8S926_9ROSI|nr:hypothetical protein K2173_011249 [Erythroxylum novogranatense]